MNTALKRYDELVEWNKKVDRETLEQLSVLLKECVEKERVEKKKKGNFVVNDATSRKVLLFAFDKYMKVTDISQNQLAEQLNISHNTIHFLRNEEGRGMLSNIVFRLIDAIDEFLQKK